MTGARERIFALSPHGYEICNVGIPYKYVKMLSTVDLIDKHLSNHVVDQYLGVLDFMLLAPVNNREPEVWCEEADVEFAQKTLAMWRNEGAMRK